MKYYEIVDVKKDGEEFTEWKGFDLEEALIEKEDALINWERSSDYNRKRSTIECRVYDLPEDTDINDEDAVFDAVSDCIGYDNF